MQNYKSDWLKYQIIHYMRDHKFSLHVSIFAAFFDWSNNRSGAFLEGGL